LAKRILLADDSVTAQNMGRKILNDAGYDVVTVNNGSAALKRITEQRPELIVLDVYMPGYTGLEVCQRIKESADTAAIPVLLTVGKLEPFKADEAKRVHADAFIVKPFEATELLTVLAKLEEKITPQPLSRMAHSRTPVPARPTKAAVETPAGPEKPAPGKLSPEKHPEKREVTADADAGWKNRLAVPVRPPEAAPEKPVPTAFHDLRSTKLVEEDAPEPAFAVNLPPDITSEEIAAISAAAASLTGEEVPEEESSEAAEPAAEFQPQPTPAQSSPVPEWEVVASQHSSELHQSEIPRDEIHLTEIRASGNGNAIPVAIAEAQPVADSRASSVSIASEGAPEEPFTTFAAVPPPESVQDSPAEFAIAQVEPAHQANQEPTVAAAAETVEAASPSALEAQIGASTQAETAAPTARLSDSEVAAALETLAPAESAAPVAAAISSESQAVEQSSEAGAPGASSLVENLYSFKWIAQEVPLDQSVSTLILEQEMQKVYAAIGRPEAHSVDAAETEVSGDSAPHTGSLTHDSHVSAVQPQEEAAVAEVAEATAAPHALEATAIASDEGHTAEPVAQSEEAASLAEALPEANPETIADETERVAALGFIARSEEEWARPVEPVASTPQSAEAPSEAASQGVPQAETPHIEASQPEPEAEARLAEPEHPAPAAEAQPVEQFEATPELEPTVETAAEGVAASESSPPIEAVGHEAVAAHEPALEEQPAALAAAASASRAASLNAAAELAPAPVATTVFAQPAQDHRSTRWDEDDQPPDVAAAWARWRQIRDSLATPELASQLAGAAELAAAESHAATAADFKDIRRTEPAPTHAEVEPKAAAAAAATSDSAVISSIVESVLAELKPKLVEEIAKKLGNK